MSSAPVSSVVVRHFTRTDRDQVTSLVNAHIDVVVPNVAVSVSGLMSQLERDPGEFIVDPWVSERITLVAEQRERVVAAAHLLRYSDQEHVGSMYRGTGEIRWLVCWPNAPYWPDSAQAASVLTQACLAQFTRWGVRRAHADGALPAPGVYGVPEQWPHIREAYRQAGFRPEGTPESVFLARIADLPPIGPAPIPGLAPARTLGINGTRICAMLGAEMIGFIEMSSLDRSPRTQHTENWADIGNLQVLPTHRRLGVGTWLLSLAGDWLDLGSITRLLAYEDAADDESAAFLAACGFRLLTRTIRGLTLP